VTASAAWQRVASDVRRWDDRTSGYLPEPGPLRPMPVPYWSEANTPDAITFEVVRHRLYAVVEEQGITITRVSGSPVATFAHDFATSLLTADAEVVYFGPYNQPQVGSIDLVTKWVLEHRAKSLGITDGDMFLCNDPWIGVSHQADVVIVCPVFHNGRLLCWVASTIHAVDVGGSTPGGFCPDARTVYDEPLPTPAIKYVEGGEVRPDLEDMFLRRSRLPDLLQLDLRALIASNTVARQRVGEIVARFGAEAVVGTMAKVLDDAERIVASRLDSLPDGEWTDHRYLDVAGIDDRGIYPAVVRLRKYGKRLIFSNAGSHPQVGAASTTIAGWRAGTLAAAMPMLGYDLMYAAGGLLRRIAFDPVLGTVLSASHPASVSNNQMGSSCGHSLAMSCISRMLACSDDASLRRRAMAGAATPFNVSILSGIDSAGNAFGSLALDPMGAGFGAFAFRDGQDTGGRSWDPIATMPNVEYNERYFPVLYLYRRECADSGGAGMFRGGNSGVLAITAHKVKSLTIDMSSGGWAVPWAAGLFGGYPGCTNGSRHVSSTKLRESIANGRIPQSLAELGGAVDELPPRRRNLALVPGDVYEMVWAAGGGFGDPRRRDPELVSRDVREGKVTAESASRLYGVEILDEHDGDHAIARAVTDERDRGAHDPVGPQLSDDRSTWLCPSCAAPCGKNAGGCYLGLTLADDVTVRELSPHNRDARLFVDHSLVLRMHRCRVCEAAIDAYVVDVLDAGRHPLMRVG
jgi:N-methylhydantoinase B